MLPQGPLETTRLIGHKCKHSNVFSWVVLISREAYWCLLGSRWLMALRLNSLLNLSWIDKNSGDYSRGETPLPIPNREVKTSSADGTTLETRWESRSLPGIIYKIASCEFRMRLFLLRYLTGDMHSGVGVQSLYSLCPWTLISSGKPLRRFRDNTIDR